MNNPFSITRYFWLNRMRRLGSLRRLSSQLIPHLTAYYILSVFSLKTSDKLKAINYFFLTLINCDLYSGCKESGFFAMTTSSGHRLFARQPPMSSDLETLNQVWGREEYKVAVDLLESSAGTKAKTTIIDAGANVGYSTAYFKSFITNTQIIAIEPDDNNFSMLVRNTSKWAGSDLHLIKAGIWDKSTHLQVKCSNGDQREWALQVEAVEHPTGLQGISLSDLVRDHNLTRIDLLKIDIEGAEFEIFKDKKAIMDVLSITYVVAIEIHDSTEPKTLILNTLRECGFDYFSHSDMTICFRPHKNTGLNHSR